MVTVLVTVFNIAIRNINIKLISIIGYPTESKQTTLIMMNIFWATFINTGIIILLTNANLSYAPYPFRLIPLHYQFSDLDQDWYI